ncbi:MAG: cysteine hydrolase [Dehalococcoidia bacterium]|nr:cysteine hydrolase [Dehalococcoidia bacterium]
MIDATPYPWPYDGLPAPDRMALVLVAPQAAFAWMDATGRVREVCVRLRRAAEAAGLDLCLLRFGRGLGTPRRLSWLPDPAAPGWAWLPGFEPGPGTLVVDVPALDGFYATGLEAHLWSNGIRHLLLAGFGTETAIHSTLRSANDRGFECLVLEDACADADPAIHRQSMNSIEMSGGIFGAYTGSDAVLRALDKQVSIR